MKTEKIVLKDRFSVLEALESNAVLETFLPYNMTEMHRESQKRPTVLVCPGGGYAMCSQREAEPIALRFVAMGYNAVVLWYTCAPKRFPTQLCEVAAAMELLYENATDWNIDTNRIAICGFSAGGHLAAHYSTAYNCDEVRALFPESKPVNATILGYPVITADTRSAHIGSFVNLTGNENLSAKETEKFSCDRLVSDSTPPAFLWHTAEDACVPVENSLLYTKALVEHKIPVELHVYPFGGHGLATADGETCDEWLTPAAGRAAVWFDDCHKFLKLIFG